MLVSRDVAKNVPAIVSRKDWYEWLRLRLPSRPNVLTSVQREAITACAARDAIDAGFPPPFELKPGLIGALLSFYDELHRYRRSTDAFERLGIPTCAYKGLGFFDTDEVKDIRALLRYLANPLSELRAAAFLRSRFMGVSDCALAELAGGLCDALVRVPESEKVARLNAEDRRILELARLAVPGWVQLVDRMSPCEVLDHVIVASAYMTELGTGQTIQKRENIKKICSMVRRAQNRGYATMQRIADEIDDLKGDVSNVVVDAVDAVSLMTVHAAKGLEFPVVFLVDLSRGTGARSSPINIVFNEAGERPSFSVWSFRTKVRRGGATE